LPFRQSDDPLHLFEILFQRQPAFFRKPVFRARCPVVECFAADDIPGVLELSGMHAQVAVRGFQHPFQIGKCEHFPCGKCADDAQSDPFMDQPVKFRRE